MGSVPFIPYLPPQKVKKKMVSRIGGLLEPEEKPTPSHYLISRWETDYEHQAMIIGASMAESLFVGYVGVNNSHVFYGKKYNEIIKFSIKDKFSIFRDLSKKDIEKTPEEILDVYGGVNYSGDCHQFKFTVSKCLWWFGFIASHNATREQVTKECNNLSSQLSKIVGATKKEIKNTWFNRLIYDEKVFKNGK